MILKEPEQKVPERNGWLVSVRFGEWHLSPRPPPHQATGLHPEPRVPAMTPNQTARPVSRFYSQSVCHSQKPWAGEAVQQQPR